ncbi:ATP-grasp domain-containing protein [Clostridium butyricum]|uniref:ATP-grasp domain-containing protein n=1 Tax=Clostridium butyricum TaxID=1492 RepID=UPI002AB1D1AC|nr:ATP-grasp domain-containing protein [Clostridium butyricum]
MKRIFVGPKQVTINNSNFFDGSITLFGNNTNNNISYKSKVSFEFWNPDNVSIEIGIYNNQISKLTEPIEIMAHNPKVVSSCTFPKNVQLICKNESKLLEILDNKIQTRNLMKGIVPMLDYYTVKGEDFNYKELSTIGNELVVQLPIGSGGSKTILCNKENINKVMNIINPESYYSISVYQRENVPYNIHCIIFDNQIEVLAPSQQALEVTDLIEYIGSEYDIEISNEIKKKLVEYSMNICNKIQSMGYRGVLGIDFIETNGELLFIEINPRFQGSTPQVDKLLQESMLPSIFEYNYYAFKHKDMPSTKEMKYSIF